MRKYTLLLLLAAGTAYADTQLTDKVPEKPKDLASVIAHVEGAVTTLNNGTQAVVNGINAINSNTQAIVTAVESGIQAVETDPQKQATLLAWVQTHPYATAAIATAICGSFLYLLYNKLGNNSAAPTDTKAATTASGIWQYKGTIITTTVLVAIAAACIIDLQRGDNSIIKKLFAQKPAATTTPPATTPTTETTPVTPTPATV